jgi:SPP1 family predicted phage head-tail adaptor
MAKRDTRQRRLRKHSTGDMRIRIKLKTRTLKPPVFGSASHSEAFESISVWAKVETVSMGRRDFDNVNIEERPTHLFTIRFREDVTAETFVEYRGENYDVLNTVDPEERQQYLELQCKVKGDKTLEANK